MKLPYLLVFFIYSVVCNNNKEAEEKKKRIIDQLTRTRPVILKNYQLVTRHVAVDVYMFRSYRTVSIVFYPIKNDISEARFTFQSEELHLNNIGSCDPQHVVIQLKHGSFPAVNPDGYSFPKKFVDPSRRTGIHTLELLSDGRNITYSIENPKPGMWYALVYIKWEDPRSQKVEQQGLVADCHTILYTDLQAKIDETSRYVSCYKNLVIDYTSIPITFKCKSKDNIEPISLDITLENSIVSDRKVSVKIQSESLPTEEDFIIYCAFDPKSSNVQIITFNAYPAATHFIYVDFIVNQTNIADCESYSAPDFNNIDNQTLINLMRDDKDQFFTFDYGLPTTDLQDATSIVNLTSSEMKVLRFDINQFDIGGSLSIQASLLMNFKYYMGYKRDKETILEFTDENPFFKVVICMNVGHPSIPLSAGYCKFNDHVKAATFVLNSTDSDSIYDTVIIPYPEGGTWYLTFRLFCDSVVCPCRTSDNGTKYYIEPKMMEDSDEEIKSSIEFSNITREGITDCNTTVLVSVSSATCVGGRCNNNGNCGLNTFSGLVMSYCSCSSGYGGWDCSDDSRMDGRIYMLISVLLLTLSNLLFLFSTYVAIIRLYYTEAMIYVFTMVFSTFYHACDAPVQIAYCIIRGNILQFGDFYCGLMSFWVTLLAMSIINIKLLYFLQLTGAIIIALLTTWNMHSFISFLLPVAVGATILLLSWYLDYYNTKCLRYPKNYYSRYLPLGLVLVSVGLICYAFLQTEQNYKIVHSVWHMIIALSVVFLLPDVKRLNAHAFLPSADFYRAPLCRFFHRSQNQ